MRLRKNCKRLSAAEKAAFISAVATLKGRPSVLHPGDPNFGRYDDYVEVHLNAMMASPGWAHTRPAFFPWHRELVLQFENDLRQIDSTVTVPYWDWTDLAPFTADFLGGNGRSGDMVVDDGSAFAANGPNHWTLKVLDAPLDPTSLQRSFGTRSDAMALPTPQDVTTALGITPYDSPPWRNSSFGFRAQVEYALHNLVHRYVNGTMYNMTSPNDPIFWLHHCNIDRLWAIWQRQNPTTPFYLPASGAGAGQDLMSPMIFHDTGPAPWPGSATPASVINHLALGYTYDTDVEVPQGVRQSLAFLYILFGVINDAPGLVIGPDGKLHRVPGGPGDPGPQWEKLAPEQRDALVGLALADLSTVVHAPELKGQMSHFSTTLIQSAGIERTS
jgi:tyrosinase